MPLTRSSRAGGESALRVAPGQRRAFPTVTAALRVAAPGQTVTIGPGTYRESLALDRAVTLVAESGPGTVRLVAIDAVTVTASVRLSGLALSRVDAGLPVVQITAAAPDLSDCEIVGGRLEVGGEAAPVLRSCRISAGVLAGLH